MNGEWSLNALYKGFDDPAIKADTDSLAALNTGLELAAQSLASRTAQSNLALIVPLLERHSVLAGRLSAYGLFCRSVNTADAEAASFSGRVSALASAAAKATACIMRYIANISGLSDLVASSPALAHYSYYFRNAIEDGRYLLSDEAEEALALYDISGGGAWEELHSYMTSNAQAACMGETLNLAAIRNLAYSPDSAVRRAAYDAELACYDKVKDSVAFALNSIKHQSLCECRLRGFASPLDKSLHHARMKRETLNALMEAVKEYLPMFHEYLRAKGRALGHNNGLPWQDMFAPMGSFAKSYTANDACEYLCGVFAQFDPDMASMARRAFASHWIDLYPRAGKVGGAYCEAVPGLCEFRVLTNFGGRFSDVVTLAHELGHGYHDMLVCSNAPLNRDYSMPVAETASTFNENLVVSAAIAAAQSDDERLALVENRLMDTAQIICDIYSRFLFEKAVCERRSNSFMFPNELCDMMHEAQLAAYGDGLEPATLNPYMWLCKSHYYSASLGFYNYPYAFGGLFARGLYQKHMAEGPAFLPRYRHMLASTPVMDTEDAARLCGVDVTDKNFWQNSLESFRADIELFKQLCTKHK